MEHVSLPVLLRLSNRTGLVYLVMPIVPLVLDLGSTSVPLVSPTGPYSVLDDVSWHVQKDLSSTVVMGVMVDVPTVIQVAQVALAQG
jgi:hypothetical protein